MQANPDSADTDQRLVSVTLERTVKRMDQWEYFDWHIAHVQDLSADADSGGRAPTLIAATPSRFTWSRVPVTLYKDAAEGYWYNLSGNLPSVFVVCCPNEDEPGDDELDDDEQPLTLTTVTVNHDEAASHLETDDTVLSIAMPESLRAWLERFVERHYRPEKRKKRKRTEWDEQQHEAERPRVQRPVR